MIYDKTYDKCKSLSTKIKESMNFQLFLYKSKTDIFIVNLINIVFIVSHFGLLESMFCDKKSQSEDDEIIFAFFTTIYCIIFFIFSILMNAVCLCINVVELVFTLIYQIHKFNRIQKKKMKKQEKLKININKSKSKSSNDG